MTTEELMREGLSALRTNDAARAEALFRKALDRAPGSASAQFNLGLALAAQGLPVQAMAAYRVAAELDPRFGLPHNNMALLHRQRGEDARALDALERAVAAQPDLEIAWFNMGNVYADIGLADRAFGCYTRAAALRPGEARTWLRLARLRQAQGDAAGALAHCRRALRAQPDDRSVRVEWLRCAVAAGQAGAAVRALRVWLADATPNDAWPLALAALPAFAGMEDEATREELRRSLDGLSGGTADQVGEAACQLFLGGFHAAAGDWFDRALAQAPQASHAPDWRTARGLCHLHLDDAAAARKALEQSAALHPDHADTRWNLALLDLVEGHWVPGWEGYDWRMDARHTGRIVVPLNNGRPMWDGQPVRGRRVLLVREQGLGDTLQFARYARQVAELGAQVRLAVYPGQGRLMTSLGPDIEIIEVATEKDLDALDCDCWAFLMSLPRLLGATAPQALGPYLDVDAELRQDWARRIGATGAAGAAPAVQPAASPRMSSPPRRRPLHVALVWAGGPKHSYSDSARSMHLRGMLPLMQVEGVVFHSLMVGPPAAQVHEVPASFAVHDWEPWLGDFAQTAAALLQMDLLISVDTAAAHLGGALGIPTWVAMSAVPFYSPLRALPARPDSCWYRSLRVYTQQRPGDWTPVLDDMVRDLRSLVDAAG
ncbi:MAG: tetratricopeptide repeat protein [Burkholderiaceae bacterium]|nr:tetratricopeptide repeat protein [Burkholderiaceae bacterium]MDO9090251.1 tetratricopeptide repeat protein [Burkholderiaceae bacterium]